MVEPGGLRARKKLETRARLGDVAARLFAEHGYDAVSVSDVARAAEVADQTVWNYFPNKSDLVLDRADQVRERISRTIADRPDGQSPPDALRPIIREDIDRYVNDDPALALGQFPAQCRLSPALRRRALEFYDDLADAIALALVDEAHRSMPARVRAAALTALVQQVTEAIGDAVIGGADRHQTDLVLTTAANTALDDLADWWQQA